MQYYKDIKTTVLFLAIAFLLPLLCIFIIINYTSSSSSVLYLILFGIEAASPSVAAITAVLILHGREGISEFFHDSFTPKLNAVSIVVPVFIIFGIMIIAKVIACIFMSTSFEINSLSAQKMLIIVWSFVSEEIGWRGFLHKRLLRVVPEFAMPVILGIIWASWHYYSFITGYTDVPIIWFVLGCIADCYIYLFLLKLSRGNVLVAMLYHFSGNLFINLFCINPDMNGGSIVSYTSSVILTGLLGIGLSIYNKKGLFRHFLSKK